jgi:peptidoglycan hydrolase-like protein with peptidoglycan-binding domain
MRPHVFSGQNRGINRLAASSGARNRGAMRSAARPSRTFPQRGLNGRTDHIAERHDANWHSDWDRRHAHFFHNRFFVFDDGFWFGLDDGFYPWDYLPYYADDYYPYDYYADSQPYDNTDNNSVPAADPTVEATQEELAQQGYYNGPVDGIFGPTTRDAVAKYQTANQLNVTGSLSPDTMRSLGLPQPAASWTTTSDHDGAGSFFERHHHNFDRGSGFRSGLAVIIDGDADPGAALQRPRLEAKSIHSEEGASNTSSVASQNLANASWLWSAAGATVRHENKTFN